MTWGASFKRRTVFRVFKTFRRKKERRMARLLALLAEEPAVYKSAGELARLSQLENVVYPLLADLSRQGLVEHRWVAMDKESRLVYRLTPEGLDHLA